MGTRSIDADLAAWIEAGIISPEQASRIRALDPPSPRRSGVVREVVGYLGAVLLAVAALVLVGDVWDDLERVARVFLCIGAAVGLIATGALVGRLGDDPAVLRLRRVTLMLATIPLGVGVGIALGSVLSEEGAVLGGFLAALGYAAIVYVLDPSWASHVAVFGAAVGVALTIEPAANLDAFLWISGPLVFGLGAAWMLAASLERLPPRIEGEVLGVGALGLGSVLLVAAADPTAGGGVLMMLAMVGVAVGCLVIGARMERPVWLAAGVIGLLGYLPWVLTELFGEGVGVPIGLAVAGIALLTTLAKRQRGSR